jgi:hypothetical protein
LIVVAAGLILFVNLVRSGHMLWKRSAKFGVLVAILSLLSMLNQLPLFSRGYDTSIPLAGFYLRVAVSVIVAPLLLGLLTWLLVGSAASLYPDAWKVFRGDARRVWRRDALVALVLSLAAGAGLARVDALFTSLFHAYASIKDELFPATFNTLWPAAGFLLSHLTRTLLFAAGVGLVIYIIRAGWKLRAWWLWLALALVAISLGPAHAQSLAEFGAGWVMNVVPIVVVAVVIGLFLRDNILAYLLVLFGVQVVEALIDLFSQPNRFFLLNGVALALLAAAVLAWTLWSPADKAKSV